MSETIPVADFCIALLPIDPESEAGIDSDIKLLWSNTQENKVTARRTKEELSRLRDQLAERLSAKKSLLARVGRSGGWIGFLRENGIPRATADRLVERYLVALTPASANLLSESLCGPSENDIHRLVRSLLPRLRRVLTTPESISVFMEEIGRELLTNERSQADGTLESPSPVGLDSDELEIRADATI